MNINRAKRLLAVTAMLAGVVAASPALAQDDYPNKPIQVIHGYPAGGGADILARHFINRLEKVSGKTFVLMNRPGAAGNLAISQAAGAKPDGYTIVIGSSSNMVGARFFFKDVSFDPVKDFVPIGTFTEGGFILLTSPNNPAKDVKELIAWLKSRPQNRFAFSNQLGQLTGEYLKARTGVEAVPVAYKSAPEAYPDVQSGLVEFMIADATTSTALIKSGRLKALAVVNKNRVNTLPDLPTLRELGFQDADFSTWWALYAPAGTSPAIVKKLGGWLKQASEDPELEKTLAVSGNMVVIDDGEGTLTRLKAELARWEPLVKAARIEPQ